LLSGMSLEYQRGILITIDWLGKVMTVAGECRQNRSYAMSKTTAKARPATRRSCMTQKRPPRKARQSITSGESTVVGRSARKWHDRLSSDPKVCGGKVCVKGTRVFISVILASLASGMSVDEVADDYDVGREDVLAALLYAAEHVQEKIVPLDRAA
jgi:uncharacterized protein (DUF433 family)